jgi:hypothetical protein
VKVVWNSLLTGEIRKKRDPVRYVFESWPLVWHRRHTFITEPLFLVPLSPLNVQHVSGAWCRSIAGSVCRYDRGF